MPKLNQILAIEKGERQKSTAELTALHRRAEKPELYEGRTRTYKPAADAGEQLPDEVQLVQVRATEVMHQVAAILAPAWNIVASKDWANAKDARADVVLDGTVLIEQAPVSYLLWLEKELNNLLTFVKKMPVLDPSEKWTFSSDQNVYSTAMSWTNRQKPELKTLVKVPPTDKHPAQTETYTENTVVGKFESTRMSGAWQAERKERVLERIAAVRSAVLFAREQANNVETQKMDLAKKIFDHILS